MMWCIPCSTCNNDATDTVRIDMSSLQVADRVRENEVQLGKQPPRQVEPAQAPLRALTALKTALLKLEAERKALDADDLDSEAPDDVAYLSGNPFLLVGGQAASTEYVAAEYVTGVFSAKPSRQCEQLIQEEDFVSFSPPPEPHPEPLVIDRVSPAKVMEFDDYGTAALADAAALAPSMPDAVNTACNSDASQRKNAVDTFLRSNGFKGGVSDPKKSMMMLKKTYPLHRAVECADPDMVTMLLEKDADPQQRNSSGKSAVDIAEKLNKDGSHEGVLRQLKVASQLPVRSKAAGFGGA